MSDAIDDALETMLGGRPKPPRVLDASGQPARRPGARSCPQCGAASEHRRRSGGFGAQNHDVCGKCGHAFEELTT